MPAPTLPTRFSSRVAIAFIAGLLLVFAALAFFAVLSKAPTYDEPLHALGAWQHLWLHDFRVNPEDPPLWHYWAALGNGPHAIHADTNSDQFADVAHDTPTQWLYVVDTLFRTEGNNGDAFIMHSRAMMLIVGVALGCMIAWWSWQLAGAFAAVVATTFYCLDPNILAHAPLVKNDISLALVMLGLTWSIWRTGRHMTLGNAAAVCLFCAAAVTVKFSGLLLGPIAAALLFARALTSEPWRCFRWTLATRGRRLFAAAALCIAAVVVSYVGIWACYDFRYNPSPDPTVRISMRNSWSTPPPATSRAAPATIQPPGRSSRGSLRAFRWPSSASTPGTRSRRPGSPGCSTPTKAPSPDPRSCSASIP